MREILEARTASDFASDRIEELLAPFAPVARVRPRRLDDLELLAFAGLSRHGLYRAIASGVLVPERAPVPGSRCFLTLEAIAAWRASRFTPANGISTEKTKAAVATAAQEAGQHGKNTPEPRNAQV